MKRLSLALAGALLWLILAPASAQPVYEVRYDVTLAPDDGRARVAVTLGKGAQHVRWIRFNVDPERHEAFEGDGEVEREEGYVTWTPPDRGGTFRLDLIVDNRRGNAFDARMTDAWAIFRGDDLVPPARVRMRKGAEADATLTMHLPDGWSFVTAYPKVKGETYRIENPERSFVRPTGWMAAGHLGVRWERIDDVSVFVAGPVDQGARRMDMMAFLRWNLPRVRALVPGMTNRLLVVIARDGMWRGGLSGPHSFFIHADRPLLSENGTSTPLHELMHVATGLQSSVGSAWIVEGLVEYYSLEIMRRSGTIGERRFQEALEKLEEWGRDAVLRDDRAPGEVTARAVIVMHELDREIRKASGDGHNLDDVLRELVSSGRRADLAQLRDAVAGLIGREAKTLRASALPGID